MLVCFNAGALVSVWLTTMPYLLSSSSTSIITEPTQLSSPSTISSEVLRQVTVPMRPVYRNASNLERLDSKRMGKFDGWFESLYGAGFLYSGHIGVILSPSS